MDMDQDTELRESPSTSVEWKIKTFLDLPAEVDYLLRSPRFSLSDSKWFLEFFPNGRTTNNGRPGWLSLYLSKEHSASAYRVAFTLGIKKADGTEFTAFDREEISYSGNRWGRAKVIRRSDLPVSNKNKAMETGGWGWGWPNFLSNSPDVDDLTPNGILTVFCRAKIVDAPLLPITPSLNPLSVIRNIVSQNSSVIEAASQTSDGIPTLMENFKDLYLNRRQTDVTILVKDREYFCHRSFLSARSPVFDIMFNHNMTEKNTGRIEIDDCDPDSFGAFLLFLYTSDLNVVTSSNAPSLYEIAKKYNLTELQSECIQCMIQNLSVDLICDVLHLASFHDETELLKAAIAFFNRNTKSILLTTKWHTFISENPLVGNELIIKSFDNVKSNNENEDSK